MSAYPVIDLDIHDPEAVADYRSKALPGGECRRSPDRAG
jgi:uncharacterized protein (DUF1330 family)